MTKDELKKFVCSYLDANRERWIANGEKLLRMPELAYCEQKTAAFVQEHFTNLGLETQSGLAITGKRADLPTGKPGPHLAVLGELDALIVPNHPFADPETRAAHACGHHAALNAMLACAEIISKPEVLAHLSGTVSFIATPSEECQDQPYIASLIESGKLQFFGGKSELIAEGVFDDIDISVMLHAGAENFTTSGFNGFVMKQLIFHGRSAHAGAYPELGINAVSMMRSARGDCVHSRKPIASCYERKFRRGKFFRRNAAPPPLRKKISLSRPIRSGCGKLRYNRAAPPGAVRSLTTPPVD